MMPFLLGVLLSVNLDPSKLTIPIPPDPKEVWIGQLHLCENQDNVKRILDTNGKYSYGYLMFQMKTWLDYGKDFGTTRENISDDELQKKVARSMLDDGLWRHWLNCGRLVQKSYGRYPSSSR